MQLDCLEDLHKTMIYDTRGREDDGSVRALLSSVFLGLRGPRSREFRQGRPVMVREISLHLGLEVVVVLLLQVRLGLNGQRVAKSIVSMVWWRTRAALTGPDPLALHRRDSRTKISPPLIFCQISLPTRSSPSAADRETPLVSAHTSGTF